QASRPPTARPSSPTTSPREPQRQSPAWRPRGTRTSARPTCTSSRTAPPPKTSTSAPFPTRPRPGGSPAGPAGGAPPGFAAGFADAALGTASGGSIRIPAACCGVVGFKPTYGLVSLDGCFPLAPSFDHAGPMARDVPTCTTMMEALAPGFARQQLESLDEI